MASPHVKGLGGLERFCARALDVVMDAGARALVVEGNETMTDAKEQTPVDTGTLRASGTVFPPERTATRATVSLGFGGAATYAVPVHERLDVSHPNGGNAKFLERPTLARAPSLGRAIAAEVERALKRLAK